MPNAMEISRYAPERTCNRRIRRSRKKHMKQLSYYLRGIDSTFSYSEEICAYLKISPKILGCILKQSGNLIKFYPLQNFCPMKGLIFWKDVLSLLIWLFLTKRIPNPKPIWDEILMKFLGHERFKKWKKHMVQLSNWFPKINQKSWYFYICIPSLITSPQKAS